jgi:hypothetical protein
VCGVGYRLEALKLPILNGISCCDGKWQTQRKDSALYRRVHGAVLKKIMKWLSYADNDIPKPLSAPSI